jgi:hypothetical protein
MYKGWILSDKKDAAHLVSLGVTLGEYNEKEHSYENCTINKENLKNLDPYWQIRYIWGLFPDENISK